jgi:hypothetical protein
LRITPCSINHMLLGYAIWRGWSDRSNEIVGFVIIVGKIRWALLSPEEAESMLVGWPAELFKESESSLRRWGGRSHWTACLRVRICGIIILIVRVHDKPWGYIVVGVRIKQVTGAAPRWLGFQIFEVWRL